MQKINYLLLSVLLFGTAFLASCSKNDEDVVNPTPEIVITAEDFTTTIDENVVNGSSLGTIKATLPDGSLSFELMSQEPDGAIALNSSTGELTVDDASLFDFETNPVIKAVINISAEGVESKRITATITLKDKESEGFVTTWQTVEDNEAITIPVNAEDYTYNYTVNWGDGTIEKGITGNATHTYASAGTHTVEITGDFPAIYFFNHEESHKIISIEQWGNIGWKSMEYAFGGCKNLNISATDAPDLSQVTSMQSMFWNALSVNSDLSAWDVSNVTDMSGLFHTGYLDVKMVFNGDISTWDVSNVTDMGFMFNNNTAFNQDLSSWNVENVTNMRSMFDGASAFNQNLSSWNVGAVTSMNAMFRKASAFNQNLNNWDVSQVKDMNSMFAEASLFNGDISAWNVSAVEDMSYMFYEAKAFTQDLSNWNVAKVKSIHTMFSGATLFNSDLSAWDVGQVTSMGYMFSRASAFNSDLSDWDVGNVIYMEEMFYEAKVFTSDLSEWDVTQVQHMSGMFFNAKSFNSDLSNWDVSNVKSMDNMFYNASSFDANLGKWNISKTNDLVDFFSSSGMSISNYNATLHGWSQLSTIQPNGYLGANGLRYCKTGETARNILIEKGWTVYGDTEAICL